MIDWIDCLGNTWGTYMRRAPPCISASLWTRNIDLMKSGVTSDGTFCGRKPYQYPRSQIPIKSMSRDQLLFHRAWKALRGNRQGLVWVHYVPFAKMKKKFDVMQLTANGYSMAIDEAQERIEWVIANGEL